LEEIPLLIARATAARAARAEKSRAFGEIVRRFQDLAFACAFSVLGDFHLAQDAAQEAFLSAWRNLDQLRAPEAFPGWLKRVVLTQCNRITRGKQLDVVAWEALPELPGAGPDPHAHYEARERQAFVRAAIAALPAHERTVTALFYVGDYSQSEIAAFLSLPVSTVKKRLYSARQRLRERMLEMVRETLHERRPSRNEQFADTVALFTAALDSFVARVQQDRYVIAAILFGSLSHDTVWRKSDIDVLLVGRDERPERWFSLTENGVNIHALLVPRSAFKKTLERALHGTFIHSSFALSTLLYSTDDSIRAYYQDLQHVGSHDRQMRLLTAGGSALYHLAKAEKWLVTRGDVAYSCLWILYTVEHLATIEVLLQGELTTREVIPQAQALNPGFFGPVYEDLIRRPAGEATVRRALREIEAYLEGKAQTLFGPVLEYLRREGGTRTTSELNGYFGGQAQTHTLGMVYEWLADRGTIQKVPSPVRLTPKSQVVVDEAAYYFDGLEDEDALSVLSSAAPAGGPLATAGAEGAPR
jgi:RNA polymerase sigma factor (sigma-70 family)